MAVGAGFGYFAASVGWVRLRGSGVVGRGRIRWSVVRVRLKPVGLMCGSSGFGGLVAFDGCRHGLGAVWHGGCLWARALVSIGSRLAWAPLGGVRCVFRWQFLAG